ncbi:MAG: hypothetical protein NC204_00865 [Candidatus Amulumruptor caecigallinarius]|nr:hypothetical protein [Candidatus Amulumruptor caecigallinarius]
MRPICKIFMAAFAAMTLLLNGCNTIDDDRIPSMPVNINLTAIDMWNTYGVSGYGNYRIFVKELRQPANFPYVQTTATGYGGVLLVSGVDPFTLEAAVPLAYDLSCPVEVKPDIRIKVEIDKYVPVAVCPKCGSTYDVVERGGSPLSGPALGENLGLRRYECRLSQYGGYLIMN